MSSPKLKPLHKQVVLITGASSGIGLTTARIAAERGAKVILVARNKGALDQAVQEITDAGGEAISAVADVANVDELRTAAQTGIDRFGPIDTFVNNAGVSIYGKIEETDLNDAHRLFETNFWGIVNGSRLAVEHLRNTGGAIINVGSEVSDVAIPLQGIYSASKHAVLGFTDALRIELESENLPISVTTIKPAAIDTPYTRHAKNMTDKEATVPPPVYAPELVAEQILHAATHPVRELYAGGGGRLMAMLAHQFPQIMEWFMSKTMIGQQQGDAPADHSNESLYDSQGGHSERGDASRHRMVREHSLYGFVSRNPLLVTVLTAGVGALAAYWIFSSHEEERERSRLDSARDNLRARLRDLQDGPLGRVAEDAKSRIAEYLR
jgi:short-subunit dehydrogenase